MSYKALYDILWPVKRHMISRVIFRWLLDEGDAAGDACSLSFSLSLSLLLSHTRALARARAHALSLSLFLPFSLFNFFSRSLSYALARSFARSLTCFLSLFSLSVLFSLSLFVFDQSTPGDWLGGADNSGLETGRPLKSDRIAQNVRGCCGMRESDQIFVDKRFVQVLFIQTFVRLTRWMCSSHECDCENVADPNGTPQRPCKLPTGDFSTNGFARVEIWRTALKMDNIWCIGAALRTVVAAL